jgi:hypothetical protein
MYKEKCKPTSILYTHIEPDWSNEYLLDNGECSNDVDKIAVIGYIDGK